MRRSVRNGLAIAGMAGGIFFLGALYWLKRVATVKPLARFLVRPARTTESAS